MEKNKEKKSSRKRKYSNISEKNMLNVPISDQQISRAFRHVHVLNLLNHVNEAILKPSQIKNRILQVCVVPAP